MREETITGSKKTIAKKVLIGKTTVKILTQDGDRLEIPITDGVGEGTFLPPEGTTLTNCSVTTNKGGDQLYSLCPVKGAHVVCFERFAARRGEKPSPKHFDAQPPSGNRRFWSPEKWSFTALLKIQTGDFAGCEIPWMLDYVFDRDTDNTVKLRGTNRANQKIKQFFELCGFDWITETIPFSENILPDLEMILGQRARKHVFQVTVACSEKGTVYVDEASELPAGFGGQIQTKQAETDEDFFLGNTTPIGAPVNKSEFEEEPF